MMTATRMTEIDWVQGYENHAEDRGRRSELGHAVMKRLRRAAIHLLDMRTEFEVLEPGEVVEERPKGPLADLGHAIARQARRIATRVLDPWTEFVSLD